MRNVHTYHGNGGTERGIKTEREGERGIVDIVFMFAGTIIRHCEISALYRTLLPMVLH
jgi:hypothetical protein